MVSSYLKYAPAQFLREVALGDVMKMHGCCSSAQHATFAKLCLEAKLANTFSKSYVTAPYNTWYYTVTGVEGYDPANQATERGKQDTKGTKQYGGIIRIGQGWKTTLYTEFPKLVFTWSTESCGFQRKFKILNKTKAIDPDCLLAVSKLDFGTNGLGVLLKPPRRLPLHMSWTSSRMRTS